MEIPAKYPCPFPQYSTKSKGKIFNFKGLAYHFLKGYKDK